jgi:ZIP family zinc transporter
MGFGRTLVLGFIAGVTILLGMPLGRLRRPAPTLRSMLNAVAVGILVFLVWDVLSAAWEPIDEALVRVHEHEGGLGRAIGYGALLAGGVAVGLLGLVAYEHWMVRRTHDPDASAIGETVPHPGGRQLALLVAVGIGLHNFAEGLAIGQAAANSDIALATLLVVGFALHNATEGFGIVAPLTAETGATTGVAGAPTELPSWGLLLALGSIGGAPTFIGTAIGHELTAEALSVVFLALAAGSILYVVVQLIGIAARSRRMDLLAYGLLLGLVAGFLTDAIVTAAGV